MQQIAKQIHAMVGNARHILLIPHQHPDGDALGSCTAFMAYLSSIGKSYACFCATGVSPKLTFLPGADIVSSDPTLWQNPAPDLVIVFDSGDLRYAGVANHIAAMPKRPTIISIDHHITNERYGDLNMVAPHASSTAEVLYHFFTANRIAITPTMATCLLTGLLTDTDNFTNAATSPLSLIIGRELIMRGADIKTIIRSVFRDKTVHSLKLWGIVLSRLQKHEVLNIVYTHVAQEDITTLGVGDSDVEGIANYLNNIGEAHATLFLKELPDGTCKGSFRTTRDDVDVSRYAKHLGGGGHRKAAGFSVPGPVEQAAAFIFGAIEKLALGEKSG